MLLADTRQILQQSPVIQAVLLREHQVIGRFSVLVEVLREAPLGLGEVAEVDLFLRFGMDIPVRFDVGIAHQAQAIAEAFALARVIDKYREGARTVNSAVE